MNELKLLSKYNTSSPYCFPSKNKKKRRKWGKRAERRDRRWSVRACPATGMRIWHRQRGRPVACGLPSRQEHLQRHRISDPYPVSPPDFHPQRHFGSSSFSLKDMYILWKLAEKWIVSSANYRQSSLRMNWSSWSLQYGSVKSGNPTWPSSCSSSSAWFTLSLLCRLLSA